MWSNKWHLWLNHTYRNGSQKKGCGAGPTHFLKHISAA